MWGAEWPTTASNLNPNFESAYHSPRQHISDAKLISWLVKDDDGDDDDDANPFELVYAQMFACSPDIHHVLEWKRTAFGSF